MFSLIFSIVVFVILIFTRYATNGFLEFSQWCQDMKLWVVSQRWVIRLKSLRLEIWQERAAWSIRVEHVIIANKDWNNIVQMVLLAPTTHEQKMGRLPMVDTQTRLLYIRISCYTSPTNYLYQRLR